MRRPLLFVMAAVLIVAVSIAGGGLIARARAASPSPPPGGWTAASLQRLPEEHLLYPGAVVLEHTSREGRATIDGVSTASSGYLLGTQDPAAAVAAFYADALRAHGWRETRDGIYETTDETRALGWTKGGLLFRLAFVRRGHPTAPLAVDDYATPFHFVIFQFE